MEELRNLQDIYNAAKARFNEYQGKDFILPNVFKEQVKEINSNSISYNDYTAIIETRGNQNGVLNIYLPNQWFYIASYFTDLYNELQRYKKEALKVTSKERLKILNGSQLNESEMRAIANLDISDTSKEYLIKFITDYNWWSGAKTIDRGDFYVSPILNSAQLVNASQSFVAELCAFLADKQDLVKAIISGEETNSANNGFKSTSSNSLQQIFYGAPGTGKSFAIEELTKGEDVIRTTFHPDSDYSTFVGAYKPTTIDEPLMTVIGTKAVPVENPDGSPRTERRIVYDFVNQAFLQAYVSAWKKMAGVTIDKAKKQYLVIEEINRGNCAQIFGDLFQLLDRNRWGFSEYPIKADADMKKQIKKQLTGLTFINGLVISALFDGKDIVGQVLEGDILLLPPNLYIWATMNTSDQSLFPIDSAFKRRWDWQYVPIANAGKGWRIKVNGKQYDWWDFLVKINALVGETTHSEDKKLGYFFCKPTDGIITAETFVSKVIFYLWNDVFKDFEFEGDVFLDTDGETKLTFDKFYKPDATVQESSVVVFLNNLGVMLMGEEPAKDEDAPADDEEEPVGRTRYFINGDKFKRKSYFGKEIMMQFLKLHPELTFQEIKDIFPISLLGDERQHHGLIASIDTPLGSYQRYYSPETFTSSDGVSFRIYKQWTYLNIDNIINFGKEHGFSIEVKKE